MKIGIKFTDSIKEMTIDDRFPDFRFRNCIVYIVLDSSKYPNLKDKTTIPITEVKFSVQKTIKDELDKEDIAIKLPGNWEMDIESNEIVNKERLDKLLALFNEE